MLEIGNSGGIVNVAAFESTTDAWWQVDVGGYDSGSEYDVLLVSNGQAFLDGGLGVELIDVGLGVFAPRVGDEFIILQSLGGVSGVFDNTPVSSSEGVTYQWDVIYNPHDVTLRVASVSAVPEPAAMSLFPLVICFCFRRNRMRGTV